MMLVNRLKLCTAILGVVAFVGSAFVWGDAPVGNPPPAASTDGVKLSDNVLSSRFAKPPVVAYETQAGDTVFALQLKPALKPDEARPDLVVMVDTSASQAGKFLDAARKIVEQLVHDVSPADRLSLWVINTPRPPATCRRGWNRPATANTASMIEALKRSTLGAVDLKYGIDNALKDFDGKIVRGSRSSFISATRRAPSRS